MMLGLRNDFVIQLELSVDNHGVHVGDFKQLGGLQTVEPELRNGNDNLYSLFIRDHCILSLHFGDFSC